MTLPTYLAGALQIKAYRVLQDYTRQLLRRFNLSPTQWTALGMLHGHRGGLRASELARELGVEKPLVTVLADQLEAAGLVDTRQNADDARVRFIRLTNKGRRLMPTVEGSLREGLDKLLMGVSPEEIQNYQRILERIVSNAVGIKADRSLQAQPSGGSI